MPTTQPQPEHWYVGRRGIPPISPEIMKFLRQWNFWSFQIFLGKPSVEATGMGISAGAVFVEVSESFMPPNTPLVPPRRGADLELDALLTEIPSWDDHTLLHMHRRYGESRLFRVHHQPESPLTERAQRLLAAVDTELERRGLSVEPDGNA